MVLFPAESPRTTSAITTRVTSGPGSTATPMSTATGPTVTQATTQPTAPLLSTATKSTTRSTVRTTAAWPTPAKPETTTGSPQGKATRRRSPQRVDSTGAPTPSPGCGTACKSRPQTPRRGAPPTQKGGSQPSSQPEPTANHVLSAPLPATMPTRPPVTAALTPGEHKAVATPEVPRPRDLEGTDEFEIRATSQNSRNIPTGRSPGAPEPRKAPWAQGKEGP